MQFDVFMFNAEEAAASPPLFVSLNHLISCYRHFNLICITFNPSLPRSSTVKLSHMKCEGIEVEEESEEEEERRSLTLNRMPIPRFIKGFVKSMTFSRA